jgi:hypothetical protein
MILLINNIISMNPKPEKTNQLKKFTISAALGGHPGTEEEQPFRHCPIPIPSTEDPLNP